MVGVLVNALVRRLEKESILLLFPQEHGAA